MRRLTEIVCRLALCSAALFVLAAVPVQAQVAHERQFKQNAKLGVLDMSAYPAVTMDGVARRLSPASRIFSVQNLIQLPATISGNALVVAYTVNPYGDLDQIWILTQAEIAKFKAAA
ncbi:MULTISPECIES: hypothetical protein [unclassified Undibacterium]|uniref:hypothetical protein n=1 Tax=unclassified Undibacterium TaxID=2630295 RepID=UPI002AC8FB7F|nr:MULTISPECIES: hypothetical protein [unclassified Undibacterium]MEB0139385.1 hypothetical protein [Undibacterium sp. CCC2.1]MEB0173350.1 hypothetical protein [Undibacterium sp. CCC1.1]MEB0177263.1 hypothetical protein [Undibacterium sp. CCC3.4]MEB0216528.1 hypothetical protein [Undibacterium sp. 5I2]WPX44044.1 hypothetical protein RHM61_02100 [Undibacterium sp. CCC3.4]